jgi:hypothetical protein
MLFTSLFFSIAFLLWGCGGRGPVEESGWEDSSGSSGSVGQYEGPDKPGAASSGSKYETPPSALFGHSQEMPEADARVLIEIQKQQLEAEKAYQSYMKGKEDGNLDITLLERAIQEFEQIQNKLDALIDKYPEDKAISDLGADVANKLSALRDDLRVK